MRSGTRGNVLEKAQGFYPENLVYALELFDGRINFAAFNAGIIVHVHAGPFGHFGLGEACLLAGLAELFPQLLTKIVVVSAVHMRIR